MEHIAARARSLVRSYRAARTSMPPVAAKSKAKAPTRAELVRELLEIEQEHCDVFARMDAIKADLKLIASVDGSFREIVPGLGHVSVSPAKPKNYKGDLPTLVGEAWLALKQPKRDKLIADGLVKIEPQYSGAYYGRVDVELYTTPA
jgi:hypothetical protein